MKTLSNDCTNLRNDAVKVREELRQEKSEREMYESQFKQTNQEHGRKIMTTPVVKHGNHVFYTERHYKDLCGIMLLGIIGEPTSHNLTIHYSN